MSRSDNGDEMDSSAQAEAGPSRSPRPSPTSDSGARQAQALLSLRTRVTPLALNFVWSAAASPSDKDDEDGDVKSEDGIEEEKRPALSVEGMESWVEERMEESTSGGSSSGRGGSSSSSDLDTQAREDLIRLVLVDCLVSAVFPPTQPDLAALALNTLADLKESSSSDAADLASSTRAQSGRRVTSSTHLLVALAVSYQRRKEQRVSPLYPSGAEVETAAAVKDLLSVLKPHLGQSRSALLTWNTKQSERTKWSNLFAVYSGSTEQPKSKAAAGGYSSLQETLLALCEDWQNVGGESALVLRHLQQAVRSVGEDTMHKAGSGVDGAGGGMEVKGVHRNVVHPLLLGQAAGDGARPSRLGRQREAERNVLLHALSSTSLAWHQKEELFTLFLAAYLADAAITGQSESKSELHSCFCTDLLVAASKTFSTSTGAEKQIRRSVLLAEIPLLISYTLDAHVPAEVRGSALTDVLTAAFASTSPATTAEAAIPTTEAQEALKADLVWAFQDLQLIDNSQASALVPSLNSADGERLMLQLHEQSEGRGVEVPTLIAGDYFSDAGTASDFFRRMIEEPTCAKDAGAALIECFKTSTTVATASLDALSLVVLALLEQPAALHTILLFTSANELGAPLRCVLTDEEVIDNLCGPGVGGDDESGMLSRVVLFIQWLAQLPFESEEQGHGLDSHSKEFNSSVSPSASRAYALRDLTEDESPLVSRWISELFDSDGIGDEIIRDSPPRILIKLAPTLLHQSILAAEQGVIDVEMLKGGCSFFLQDLLSYTLPSGLVWLMRDLERIGGVHQSRRGAQGTAVGTGTPSRSSLLVTLLSMFLLDESCPSLVLELVRSHFERLQSYGGSGQALMDTSTLEALRSRFKREETKGLRVPALTALNLATSEEIPSLAPAFDRELESLEVEFPQSSSALRASLQPVLDKLSQHLSQSTAITPKGAEGTSYLASTAAALLVAQYSSHFSRAEEENAEATDGQALSGVLLALDLLVLSPAGRSSSWVQPRALVLAHVLRLLAPARGMLLGLPAGDSQTESASKQRRLQEGNGDADGDGGSAVDEDLFGDEGKEKEKDKDGSPDTAAAAAGAGPMDDASSFRLATIARLCALALLRAISLDPASTNAGVPAVLAILPGSNHSKTGSEGRQGRHGACAIEKNQRAAVWSIRSVLQLLPSALLDGANTESSGTGKGTGSGPAAGETLGKRKSSDPSHSPGEGARGRAGRIVQDVVQTIWEVVIVP